MARGRYRGVLLGVAAGNALGIRVEGWPEARVRQAFPDGVRDIGPLERSRPWDDDLAQTALLARALLEGQGLIDLEDLARRLVEWERVNGRGIGSLTDRVILALRRGTRATEAAELVWRQDGREPAGNGAVMRCSPVAMRWLGDGRRLVEQSLASAKVTHFDPRCQWSTCVAVLAVAAALSGAELDRPRLGLALAKANAPDTVVAAVTAAVASLGELTLDDPQAMGYTLKAMQVGLWCLTCEVSAGDVLVQVVSAGGDTDTNAAVAGAVLGARGGEEAVPDRWLQNIAGVDELIRLADELWVARWGPA